MSPSNAFVDLVFFDLLPLSVPMRLGVAGHDIEKGVRPEPTWRLAVVVCDTIESSVRSIGQDALLLDDLFKPSRRGS